MHRSRFARLATALLVFVSVVCCTDLPDAIAVFKTGDYEKAIPLLRDAMAQNAKDPAPCADLLSALVYMGRVDEATDLQEVAATRFPNSPEVLAARGEFFFYMGDLAQAAGLFKSALHLKEETPRAVFGMARLFRMESLYRTSRLLYLKAHQIDPDDALLTSVWIQYLVPEKRKEVLDPFIQAHPWFYKRVQQSQSTESDVRAELNEKKEFEFVGPKQQTTVHLEQLLDRPGHVRGVGVRVSIEGRKPLNLLLDTGASGILITQAAVDKAGLKHLGSFDGWGVGDDGTKKMFAAVAESCEIGTLKYNNCIFRVLEGKGRILGEEDGLIGADFFSDYLIHIDFQTHLMDLKPQPERTPNPQGYDRTIPPDEVDFTPIFRHGHSLFVSTTVNQKSTGLFLLDTGAGISNLDTTFARLSTKIHNDEYLHVKGLSGEVKQIYEADSVDLQFSRYREPNVRIVSFNLNNGPDHAEVRMSGVIGFPVLSMFRLTLDYRNGLVNFERTWK